MVYAFPLRHLHEYCHEPSQSGIVGQRFCKRKLEARNATLFMAEI